MPERGIGAGTTILCGSPACLQTVAVEYVNHGMCYGVGSDPMFM